MKYIIVFLLCFQFLLLKSQSTDLLIQKTGPVTVSLGAQMTYVITVSNSGTLVANASFNDIFPSGVSNVSLINCISSGGAICPTTTNYTLNNTIFSGTIPSLPHGSSVEFTILMNAPNSVSGSTSISNTATVDVPVGFTELNPITNSSTWNTNIIAEIDLVSDISSNFSGSLGNCTNLPLSIEYNLFWTNNGSSVDLNTTLLNAIALNNIQNIGSGISTYSFNYNISNVVWNTNSNVINLPTTSFTSFSGLIDISNSSPSTIAISNLSNININQFNIGDTVFLSYTLGLEFDSFSGCGVNLSYGLSNSSNVGAGNSELAETNPSNNASSTSNIGGTCNLTPPCTPIDIGTEISSNTNVFDSCQNYPYSINYEVYWTNNSLSVYDSSTFLINTMLMPNLVQLTNGNTTYNFDIIISNQSWFTSDSTINLIVNSANPLIDYTLPYVTPPGPPSRSLGNAIVEAFGPGDTIFYNYTITIDTPLINGCGSSFNYDLASISSFNLGLGILIDTFGLNNAAAETANGGYCNLQTNNCSSTDIASFIFSSTPADLEPCGVSVDVDYQVQWINNGPVSDINTSLQNYLFMSNVNSSGSGNTEYGFPFQIENIIWSSSNLNTSLPNTSFSEVDDTLYLSNSSNFSTLSNAIIPLFNVGDTITLSYSLHIDSPDITGCGKSYNYDLGNGAFFTLGNNNLIESNPANNSSFIYNFNGAVSATDLAISESVNPAIVNHLDTTEITVIFQNASDVFTNNASWSQILPSEFNIIQSSINCVTTAGTTICSPVNYNATTNEISQTVPVMEANSTIEITFSGWVNSIISTTVNLEANASINCFDCVPQTNFTQTTFQIDGLCDLAYAGEISIDASDCNGINDGQAIILTSGPYVGNLSYIWSDSLGNVIPSLISDTANNLLPGGYSITVIDDGVPGCQIQDSIYVSCINLNGPNSISDDTSTLEDEIVEILVLANDSDNVSLDSTSIDLDPNTAGQQDSLTTTDGIWFVSDSGTVIFVPNENFNGTAQINYTVDDDEGNTSNISTIEVEVFAVNDEPQISNDTVFSFVNNDVEIDLFANDNDASDPNGGIDTSSLQITIGPNHGSITIDSVTGSITYTPNNNFVGVDSFLYVLCDNGIPAPVNCDSAWVYIVVSLDNQFINALNDSVYTNINEATAIFVLENDSVLPNDFDLSFLQVTEEAQNGSVSTSVNYPYFNYLPNPGFYGVDSFQYVICDNGFITICDTAMVYVYIFFFPESPNCELSFPEAISPNNDGLNDYWVIGNLDCYPNHDLEIFNRWGNIVYKTKTYKNDWEGQTNYEPTMGKGILPAGTYFYIFKSGVVNKEATKGFIYLSK